MTSKKTTTTKKPAKPPKPAAKPKTARKNKPHDAPGTATADAPVGSVPSKPSRKPKAKAQADLNLPPAARGKVSRVTVFRSKADPAEASVVCVTEKRGSGKVAPAGAYFFSERNVTVAQAEATAAKLREHYGLATPGSKPKGKEGK